VEADADGPYQIGPGEAITLDASGSSANAAIAGWYWDLDDDGEYDDLSGELAPVSYDYLVTDLGLPIGAHSIGLKVSTVWSWDTDTAVLEIIPEPATLGVLVVGGIALLRRRRK
jgi:hypothetical protein